MPPAQSPPPARYQRRYTTLLLLSVAACNSWSRIPAPAPAVLDSRMSLQVWSAGRGVVLRNVSVESDSIRGVPPVTAARSGRVGEPVAFSLSEVDSVRTMQPQRRNGLGVGLLGGFLVGAGAMFLTVLGLSADDS